MANHLPSYVRDDLARVAEGIRAAGPALDPERAAARHLADGLRENLPDLDEVAIGRVALYLASNVATMAAAGYDPRRIGNVFILAAVDLTASAIDSPDGSGS